MPSSDQSSPNERRRPRRRGAPQSEECALCGQSQRYFRTCRICGFAMCQDCTDDNLWGITCNHITWTCPDCGETNGF